MTATNAVHCPLSLTAGSGGGGSGGGPSEGEPERGERMGGNLFFTRRGKLVCKFYFVVQMEQDGDGLRGEIQPAIGSAQVGPQAATRLQVVLDPNEHAAYLWATKNDVED